jgi:TonB family protein
MNKIVAVFLGMTFFVGGILPSIGFAQQIDPFYLQRMERGERAFAEGNFETAVEELNIALFGIQTDEQLRAKAYVYLGMSLFHLSDKEKAKTYLNDAKDILGMDGLRELITDEAVWFYLNRSMVELKLLEPENKQPGDSTGQPRNPPPTKSASINPRVVERDLERQIKANPRNPRLYYALYEHYMENDNPKEAKKTVEKLIENNPDEAKGFYLLGKMQYKQRELKKADENLREVFKLQGKTDIEEYVLLEAKVYHILTARLIGDRSRAYEMLADWSNLLTQERIRYMDLDEQDRGIMQGIFESEEYLQSISGEEPPNSGSHVENTYLLEEVDRQPELRDKVDPVYPPVAARRGIKGLVIVNALISETGDVIDAEIVQGLPGGLNEEVLKAVNRWKYEPAMKDGQAVKVWKRITITFKTP